MLWREGRSESTAKQPLHWSKDFQRRNRRPTCGGPHKERARTKQVKKMHSQTGRPKPAHTAALDSVLLRKHLVKNLSALVAWQSTAVLKARTSKPYICTLFATDTTGKGDQDLFLFKPYSEILSKAGSEQSFLLDHGILNLIFLCTYVLFCWY